MDKLVLLGVVGFCGFVEVLEFLPFMRALCFKLGDVFV